MIRIHLRNWSLRAKLAALMVAASVLPLALSALLEFWDEHGKVLTGLHNILTARAEQIALEFDSTHLGYLRSVDRLSRLQVSQAYCGGDAAGRAAQRDRLAGVLATFPASDRSIRAAGVVDPAGRVVLATEARLEGADLSHRPAVRAAIAGKSEISNVYLSSSSIGVRPTVAYLVPVKEAGGRVLCVIGVMVDADVFLRELQGAAGKAGPGSFAVLYDSDGVRMAHTSQPELVSHPAGPLEPAQLEQMVAVQRFGPRTRELLQDVRPFAEQFERARAAAPDGEVFRAFSPANHQWNYGVARRLRTVPWTVFYMVPEPGVAQQVADAAYPNVLLALGIMVAAMVLGTLVAANILRPVRNLADATAALAADAGAVRVPVRGDDELARLGASFNAMADGLAAKSEALKRANAELEQRVRERTGLLNAVIDNSPAPIYATDLNSRFLLVNQRFAQLFGLRKEDMTGKTSYELVDRAVADAFHAMNMRVARGGQSVSEEEALPLPDGIRTYLSVKCPLRDCQGQAYGVVGVSTDITARKQAESRQQAQLERLQLVDEITTAIGAQLDLQAVLQVATGSLEERMPADFCCICSHDESANTISVAQVGAKARSPAAAHLSEGSVFALGGNGLARCMKGELVYEPDIAASAFAFPQRLAAAGLRSLVIAPLQAQGRARGVLVAARRAPHAFDSTDCEFVRQLSAHVSLAAEQAQLHEALRRAYEDLRQSQQAALQRERLSALGQMASGIAHDINNAISPAALYAESLLQGERDLSERGRGQLEVIARAIDDVAATVARMREFYRPRELQTSMTALDLNEVVRQVAQLTHARWSDMPQQRGISVRLALDLTPELPPLVGVDSELREALINLIFNAVDAMPAGGTLTLRTRADPQGRHADLEVADDGVGMDAETRRRCLEPFFTTKGERGTGLGLAMVYGVAQRHQAQIDIDSAPGSGTTVRLRLPAGAPAASSSGLGAPAAPLPPLRLLLVDDEPLLTQSLGDALRAEGHEVTAVDGGQAGIDAFAGGLQRGRAFQAVITDLGMPHVGGREVAAAVKRAAPGTPVILLTGWGARLSDDEQEPPPDVDAVLAKPPRLREIRAVLARLLIPEAANHG